MSFKLWIMIKFFCFGAGDCWPSTAHLLFFTVSRVVKPPTTSIIACIAAPAIFNIKSWDSLSSTSGLPSHYQSCSHSLHHRLQPSQSPPPPQLLVQIPNDFITYSSSSWSPESTRIRLSYIRQHTAVIAAMALLEGHRMNAELWGLVQRG